MPALPLPRWSPRRVLIQPEAPRAFEPAEWRQALVVVERGMLELEWRDGNRLQFGVGDTLCMQDLGLTVLRAVGIRPTLLLVVRR